MGNLSERVSEAQEEEIRFHRGDYWDKITGQNAFGETVTHIIPQEGYHHVSHLCLCDPEYDEDDNVFTHRKAN